MYTQQPLRFDPTRLQHQFLNLTLENPPFVPNIPTPGPLTPFLPFIAAFCAIEIQQKAQANALRTFMFNQYAVNAFCNPDFEALVDATVKYIDLKMRARQYNTIEEAIQHCVPQAVEMLAAMALPQNPGLEQYTDPATQQYAQRLIHTFQQIGQQIQQERARGIAPQMQNPQPYGSTPYPGQQMQMHRAGNYGGYATVSAVPTRTTMGGGSLVSSGPASGPQQSDGPSLVKRYDGARYALDPEPTDVTPTRAAVAQPFSPRTPNQETASMPNTRADAVIDVDPTAQPAQPKLIPYKDMKFKGSFTFPYFPAFHPSQLALHYEVDPTTGATTPKFVRVDKNKEDNMDFEKHALADTVFGAAPRRLDLVNHMDMLKRVQSGVKQMAEQARGQAPGEAFTPTEAAADPAADPLTVYVHKAWLGETSLDTAWAVGEIERVKQNLASSHLPDIFRIYAEISTTTISDRDESELVKELGACKTFLQLQIKLNELINSMTPQLFGVVNTRLTETVNRIVAQNLSVPGVKIDSFAEDLKDLIEYLESNFGEVVKTAFLRHQEENIQAALHAPEEEVAVQMVDSLLERFDFQEGQAPKVTFVTSSYSLTYLNVISHALDLELNPDGSAAVLRGVTPMFYDLLNTLFEERNHTGEEGANYPVHRHLIRTLDGRILEATKGYIGEAAGQNFYLLTLVE